MVGAPQRMACQRVAAVCSSPAVETSALDKSTLTGGEFRVSARQATPKPPARRYISLISERTMNQAECSPWRPFSTEITQVMAEVVSGNSQIPGDAIDHPGH